jgi:hypothetical protein
MHAQELPRRCALGQPGDAGVGQGEDQIPMIDLKNTDLFDRAVDAASGVTSYVLRRKAAPVQEAFYFVTESVSRDQRYLWFYCAFPPSGNAAAGRTLGVVPQKQLTQVASCDIGK